MTEDEKKSWNRILAKRREDCRRLGEQTVAQIVDHPLFRRDAVHIPSSANKPHEKLDSVLRCMLYGSMNDKLSPGTRRKEYLNLKMLLKRIDEEVSESPQISSTNNFTSVNGNGSKKIAKNHSRITQIENRHQTTNKFSSSAKSQKDTYASQRQSIRTQSETVVSRKQNSSSSLCLHNISKEIQDQRLQGAKNISSRLVGDLYSKRNGRSLIHRKEMSTVINSAGEPLSTKSAITSASSKVVHPALAQPSAKLGSVLVPVQQSMCTDPEDKKLDQFVVPQIKIGLQPATIQKIERWFPEDSKKFSGALEKREQGMLAWRNCILTQEEISHAISRFYKWDPYWEMQDILALTKTTEIEKVKYSKADVKQAVEVNIAIPLKCQRAIKNWGTHIRPYQPGSKRLLLRMIPYKLPGEKGLKKKKLRGDYHLWPKGTLLLVDDAITEIQQRKQQAHDKKEWKSLCRTLDLVNHIRTPGNNKVRAAILDPEPYFVCVAVCEYHSPGQLFTSLMTSGVKKLSRERSIHLAINYAKKNQTVCLDDAGNDDQLTSFIFKLTCSISACLLKTPVRAPQCNHFQCFDLQNFLDSNAFVSGTRWECPVCNNELISVYDLQYCGLTAHMLDRYKDEATSFRDRIQFFSDGSWQLMAETRKRYASKESTTRDTKKQVPMEQEIIAID